MTALTLQLKSNSNACMHTRNSIGWMDVTTANLCHISVKQDEYLALCLSGKLKFANNRAMKMTTLFIAVASTHAHCVPAPLGRTVINWPKSLVERRPSQLASTVNLRYDRRQSSVLHANYRRRHNCIVVSSRGLRRWNPWKVGCIRDKQPSPRRQFLYSVLSFS